MRRVNKRLVKLLSEIVLTVILVIVSIPVWASIQTKSYAQTAEYYSTTSIIDVVPLVSMESSVKNYNKENDHNTAKGKYVVKNYSNQDKNYKLVFGISKKSTINPDNLIIEINGVNDNLTNLKNYEDSYFNYYVIDESKVSPYEGINYSLRLWQNSSDNKTIWYKLEVL